MSAKRSRRSAKDSPADSAGPSVEPLSEEVFPSPLPTSEIACEIELSLSIDKRLPGEALISPSMSTGIGRLRERVGTGSMVKEAGLHEIYEIYVVSPSQPDSISGPDSANFTTSLSFFSKTSPSISLPFP